MRNNPKRNSAWGLTRGLTQDLTQGVLRSYLGSYPVSSRQLFATLKRPGADRGLTWTGLGLASGLTWGVLGSYGGCLGTSPGVLPYF
jgi:hypothetical protein